MSPQAERPGCSRRRPCVQDEAPDHGQPGAGQRVREHERHPVPDAALDVVRQHRHQQAEPDRQGHRADHPDEGVAQGVSSAGSSSSLPKLLQADALAAAQPVVLGEAQVRRPQERHVEQHGHQQHGRGRRTRPEPTEQRRLASPTRSAHRSCVTPVLVRGLLDGLKTFLYVPGSVDEPLKPSSAAVEDRRRRGLEVAVDQAVLAAARAPW